MAKKTVPKKESRDSDTSSALKSFFEKNKSIIPIAGAFILALAVAIPLYLSEEDGDKTEKSDTGLFSGDKTEKGITELFGGGKKGNNYASYREACEAGDFEYAYKEINKLEKKVEEMRQSAITPKAKRIAAEEELTKVRDYVYDKECLYLLSMKTSEAQERLIYLLKEHDYKNVDILIDTAIGDDDEAFISSIINKIPTEKYDVWGRELEKIKNYLKKKDSEEAKTLLLQILETNGWNYDSDIEYLISANDDACTNLILQHFAKSKSSYSDRLDEKNSFTEHVDRISDLCIIAKNEDLLKKLISLFSGTPLHQKIQQKYQRAKNDGVFQ
ncbi:MAG: hypothetical protein IJ693_02580 [Bacteroidaceae bacterium]|nr:hypothetical protein [Bacteroidaceae bacterium]